MNIERLLKELEDGKYRRAYRTAEILRKKMPIETIRSSIYDLFRAYQYANKRKAKSIVSAFKGYGLENWL